MSAVNNRNVGAYEAPEPSPSQERQEECRAQELWRQAREGNALSMRLLGGCFEHGTYGSRKDPKVAFYWYREAAKEGERSSLYRIGRCYRHGIGIPQNERLALAAFQWGHEVGSSGASLEYGRYLEEGIFVDQDLPGAFAAYQAASRFITDAHYFVGRFFERGVGMEKNEREAFLSYQRAARVVKFAHRFRPDPSSFITKKPISAASHQEQGQRSVRAIQLETQGIDYRLLGTSGAQYRAVVALGECYEKGIGVAKNLSEAFAWYKIAAECGHSGGWCEMGRCHQYGIGTPRSIPEMIRCYKQAIDMGNGEAAIDLGLAYENGIQGILEINRDKARECYLEADADGEPAAGYFISQFLLRDIHNIRFIREQFHRCLKSVNHPEFQKRYPNEFRKGCLFLARAYTEGRGCAPDPQLADYYRGLAGLPANEE